MRENDLLRHVYASNARLPGRVTIPPGDDMGAFRTSDQQVLVTVDQLVEGIHFDRATATPAQIGRKAITRNLSDVAAMAAQPVGAVVAVCLPRDFDEKQAKAVFDAMRQTGEQYGCPLIGGDVSMWDHPLIATVTVFAEPAGIDPVLRQGAQVGDAIYVTGRLGGSTQSVGGRSHHLDFEPRLNVARALAGRPATRPHCMIDISDGLARDLDHLCEAANVRAQIDAASLPIADAAHDAARISGRPAWQHAVGDGEDYELLFTAPPAPEVTPAIDGVSITRVGTIQPTTDGSASTSGGRVTLRLQDGSIHDLAPFGWEHHSD